MAIQPWNPFREMEAIRREIDRVFNSRVPEGETPRAHGAFLPGRGARQYPLVNVAETPDAYLVEALAPGVAPETLNLSVMRDRLEISGEKPPSAKEIQPEAVHRNERAAGRFTRVLQLGAEVDEDRVSAEYKDGLLLVTLPKAEKAKPRRVQIAAN